MKPVSYAKIALELCEDWSCHRKGLGWFRAEPLACFLVLGVNVISTFAEYLLGAGIRCCVDSSGCETLTRSQECGYDFIWA